ncbi:MAG TPA: hypothetical protein VK190_03345 [Pseudoneobacillus sp.]|nr:hypothetical protein [Pseudoneobacillus sp.]
MDIADRMKKIKEIDNNMVIAVITVDSNHGPLFAIDASHKDTEIVFSNAFQGNRFGYNIRLGSKDYMNCDTGFAKLKEYFIRDCKRGKIDPDFYNQILEQAELNLKEAI